MDKKLPETVICNQKWKYKNRYLVSYHDYTFWYPDLLHNIKQVVECYGLETNNDFLSALDCVKKQIYTLNSVQKDFHAVVGKSKIFIERHYDGDNFYYLVGIAI